MVSFYEGLTELGRKRLQELNKKWVEEEGGIEHPTKLETLQSPEQRRRIQWLVEHTYPVTEILDIGCNWGYVLNEMNGECGVDINLENIDKAMREFPTRHFVHADVTKGLPFEDNQYSIVIMADVLEHLEWNSVIGALWEGLRVARNKVLITLPLRYDRKFALCFKHKWIPNKITIGGLLGCLISVCRFTVECDGNFVYLEISK